MLQKLKSNNHGSIPITRVICYFFLICVLAFTLDVIVVMAQNVVTSYEAAYYAEKISIQGGLIGDSKSYPSVNETRGNNNLGACGNRKKPCTSCLTNSEITQRISKTLGYFRVTKNEWQGSIEIDGRQTIFHSKVNQTAGVSSRRPMNYMDTATFQLTSEWRPIFAKWLWFKESYNIDKEVPIVIEYIAQVNKDDPACKNAYLSGGA